MKNNGGFVENISYNNNTLIIDGISCMDIISEYKNPVLIYSANRIKDNIQKMMDAFRNYYDDVDIYFAYKACYIPKVIEIIHNNGVFGEVSSSYECKMALRNRAKKIFWNSPAKTVEEIHFAIDNGVLLNVDSQYEVDEINNYATEKGISVNIGIRICTNIADKSYIGRGGKLGVDMESGQALALCRYINELTNVSLIGLHSHMSVEIITPDNQVQVLTQLVDFANRIDKSFGIQVKYISCGGGFASRDDIERTGNTINHFASEMGKVINQLSFHPKLVLEPGRYIVNDAAIAIGKIINIKKCADTTWWITDMGTNILIPFGGRRFPAIPVNKKSDEEVVVNIGDRTSSYTGVFDENIRISKLEVGDYLAMRNTGSYTFSCSQNYMYPVTNDFYMVKEGEVNRILISKSEDEYIDELYK